MSIDFTKPLQTRDGKKVRLLCTDKISSYPVVVWLEDIKATASYTLEGVNVIGEESNIDLVNVPEQVTLDVWVNVYKNLRDETFFSVASTPTKEGSLEMRGSFAPWQATLHIKRTVPVGHVDE